MTLDGKKNVEHNLALDKIEDKDKSKEVRDFFLLQGNKELQASKNEALRQRIEDRMSALNQSQASATDIITTLTEQILVEARSKNVYVSYTDAAGTVHKDGYMGLFNRVFDEVGVKVENATVRNDALAMVTQYLTTKVPNNLRPKYCHQFAEEMIKKFVADMDEEANIVLGLGSLESDELAKIKLLDYEKWVTAPERARLTDLYVEMNQDEAKKFTGDVAAVKAVLKNVSGVTGLNNNMLEYFTAASKAIEGSVTSNPAEALKKAQALEAQTKAAVALNTVHVAVKNSLTEIASLKTQVKDFDATIETGYTKLKADIDKGFTDFLESKNVQLLDKVKFEAVKTPLDTKLAAEKAKVQATPAKAPEAAAGAKKKWEIQDIINDPGGFIMAKLPWLAVVFAFVPKLGKQFNALLAKLPGAKKAEKVPDPNTTETAEQRSAREQLEQRQRAIKKAKDYIKEKLGTTEDKIKNLIILNVKDFLELSSAPTGVEQTKFAALKQSFTANGATDESKGTILEFIAQKGDKWKEPADAAVASASTTQPPAAQPPGAKPPTAT